MLTLQFRQSPKKSLKIILHPPPLSHIRDVVSLSLLIDTSRKVQRRNTFLVSASSTPSRLGPPIPFTLYQTTYITSVFHYREVSSTRTVSFHEPTPKGCLSDQYLFKLRVNRHLLFLSA